MTPINPDEALYAFVDGELELADEQQLFDALASHPELRTEMKDVLAIRNAVHRDVLFPSAAAETQILAATGLTTPVGAATVAGGTGLLSRTLYSVAGIAAGAIIAYFLFDVSGTSKTIADQQNQLNKLSAAAQMHEAQLNEARAGVKPVEPVRVETLYVRVPAKVSPPVAQVTQPVNPTSDDNTNAASSEEQNSTMLISAFPEHTYSASDDLTIRSLFRERRRSEASPLTPGIAEHETSVRLRTLPSSLNGDRRIPASVNDAILPNTSFALLLPVSADDRLGVEFGLDAFHQKFTAIRDDRPVEVDQTPVLYWIGGTYERTWLDLDFVVNGLQLFSSTSLGYAFSQGPVGHAMLGLQYQPVGPVRFSGGVDVGALVYKDRTNWFMSHKWGFTYGLSVDIGAIE